MAATEPESVQSEKEGVGVGVVLRRGCSSWPEGRAPETHSFIQGGPKDGRCMSSHVPRRSAVALSESIGDLQHRRQPRLGLSWPRPKNWRPQHPSSAGAQASRVRTMGFSAPNTAQERLVQSHAYPRDVEKQRKALSRAAHEKNPSKNVPCLSSKLNFVTKDMISPRKRALSHQVTSIRQERIGIIRFIWAAAALTGVL